MKNRRGNSEGRFAPSSSMAKIARRRKRKRDRCHVLRSRRFHEFTVRGGVVRAYRHRTSGVTVRIAEAVPYARNVSGVFRDHPFGSVQASAEPSGTGRNERQALAAGFVRCDESFVARSRSGKLVPRDFITENLQSIFAHLVITEAQAQLCCVNSRDVSPITGNRWFCRTPLLGQQNWMLRVAVGPKVEMIFHFRIGLDRSELREHC